MNERQRLVETSTRNKGGEGFATEKAAKDASGSEMIDLEAARLDVLMRRQEREMQQMAAHEQARKAIQVQHQIKGRPVTHLSTLWPSLSYPGID